MQLVYKGDLIQLYWDIIDKFRMSDKTQKRLNNLKMKKAIKLFLLSSILLSGCKSPDLFFENALCLENISTIDPVEGLKENQTIIITDGKISKVANTNELRLSPKNNIVDGSEKFLIPGLWDAHVHFAYIEDLAPSMFDLFLSYGITSVRDTGGKIAFVKKWKEKALANPSDAPRVMIAGPLLDGEPNVYDGSDDRHPELSVGLSTVDDVSNKVHELDSLGVDLLKAYEMLSPEQFAKITELAKEKGLKITGHVPLSMDVIGASNAGLNSMEHMRNLELSCASNADELLEQRQQLLQAGKMDAGGILRSRIHQAQRETAIKNYDDKKADEVLKVLAQNKTWQIPTITLSTGFSERPFARPEWQESFNYLPEPIAVEWRSGLAAFMDVEITPFHIDYTKWLFKMVGKVHQAKIDIMAGTDCPIFFLTPGRSLHQELAVLVQAGLSPLDAIKTATLNPARYFGLEDELGSIQENMWADLVILDANPLEDINNTQRINAVMKQGKYYDRNALDEKLSKLDNQ